MTSTVSRNRPTGVSILGALYIIGGLFALIGGAAIGAIAGSLGSIPLFGSIAGVVGGALAAFFIILAIIEFVIAGALLSGKSWGRKLVMILAAIDLIIEVVSLFAGNIFAIIGIIIDIIVLYYMWRPHVREYFEGSRSYPTGTAGNRISSSIAMRQEAGNLGSCPACRASLVSSSNFCSRCGVKIKTCDNCRIMNTDESEFCSNCGQRFAP